MTSPCSAVLALVLAAVSAAASAAEPAADATWDVRLVAVEGEVSVLVLGEDEALPAQADMPLNAGDRVKTGAKGRAQVAFSPDAVLEVGPGSELVIEESGRGATVLALALGHLVARIKLALGQVFRVRTRAAVTAVRGTEFAVELDEAGARTVVGVFDEGQVGVSAPADSSAEVLLGSQQETEVRDGTKPLPARRLEFLQGRAERIRHFRERRAWLRGRFKRYAKQNREELRRMMGERRRGLRERLRRERERIRGGRGDRRKR